MNYCIYDYGAEGNDKYFCDFDEKYYSSYKDCYDKCGLTLSDGNKDVLIHISNIDFVFVVGIWAVLLAIALFVGFHLSHD